MAPDYGTIGSMAVLKGTTKINVCVIRNRIYFEVINIDRAGQFNHRPYSILFLRKAYDCPSA